MLSKLQSPFQIGKLKTSPTIATSGLALVVWLNRYLILTLRMRFLTFYWVRIFRIRHKKKLSFKKNIEFD